MYLSAKAKLYLYLTGALVFLGIALGRPELMLMSLPFAISLALPLFSKATVLPELAAEIENSELVEGSETTLHLTVRGKTRTPLLKITHELSIFNSGAALYEQRQLSLDKGETKKLKFIISTLPGPGRYHVGKFSLSGTDNSGMLYFKNFIKQTKEISVFPAINTLENANLVNRPRLYHGYYTSPFRGEGLEFSEIKEYRHGDSLKHINWKKSLKWGNLLVNDRYLDRNIDVVIIVDSLSQAKGPGGNYLHIAARGAASLAHYYTGRNDRVGLIDYDGTIDPILPQSGSVQLKKILTRLSRLRESQLYVAKKATTIPKRVLPPQGVIYGLTCLSDDRAYNIFFDLASRGFYLVLIYISPTGLAGNVNSWDAETDSFAREIWELRQEAKIASLKSLGARVARPAGDRIGPALAEIAAEGGSGTGGRGGFKTGPVKGGDLR